MISEALLIARLKTADALYLRGDWAVALPILQSLLTEVPDWAAVQSVPLMAAHCTVEIAASPDVASVAPAHAGDASNTEREQQIVRSVRERVNRLCRAGDYDRAAALLQVLSRYDAPIAQSIADTITPDPARTGGMAEHGIAPFWDDPTLRPTAVADAKRRFANLRLLVVFPKLFGGNPNRASEPYDCFIRSARRFGLTAEGLNAFILPPGVALEDFAGWLQAQIIAFRPDVILYADLFEEGISAKNPSVTEQVAAVLENARARLGVRVVTSLLDAWAVVQHGVDRPLRRLGSCIDLFHHMHPSLMKAQTAAHRAASFCYPPPYELPAPSVAGGTVARAGFVGSVVWYNVGRLVWRTEAGRRGIPLDFLETDHNNPRSDQEFANLLHAYQVSVNFTARPSGARILTGRPVEVALCGGVLLEEDCFDTAYFLARGEHYEGFGTLDELDAQIERLLGDADRRRILAQEHNRWVAEYFMGDHLWAGLLGRLYA